MEYSAKKQMATYFLSPVVKINAIFKRDLREYVYQKSFTFKSSEERICKVIPNKL